MTELILGKGTNGEQLAFDSADNEGKVVLLGGEMQIMKKGSYSQRKNVSTQKLFEGHINFAFFFFFSSLQASEITHHALDKKIVLVMLENEVRTKGKCQLSISCTQKKPQNSSFPKQHEEFLQLL